MNSALIAPRTLYENISNPSLKLVDASYPAIEDFYAKARIGDAVLFDVDTICDPENPLPHMLPTPEHFAQAVGALGIDNNDDVVVYDQSGMVTAAARAWWMFRIFGHRNVKILNGGMPLWHAQGFPINFTPPIAPTPKTYSASFNPALLATRQQVLAALGDDSVAILDARSPERFKGEKAEQRPSLKSGHIPGSYNLPFQTLIKQPDGTLLPDDPRLAALLATTPAHIITSCGSGITACVLALALYESGYKHAAVYDGSWSEWAFEANGLPVAQGEGKKFATEGK